MPQGGYSGEVTEMPQCFNDWVAENADNIAAARERDTEPYFLRNNAAKVDEILQGKQTQHLPLKKGTARNIRNALKHCATKPDEEVAVIYSLNEITSQQMRAGIKCFDGLSTTSQWKKFKELIFVLPSGKIKKYHP